MAHASQEQTHQPGRNNNLIKTRALLHKYVQAGVKYATAGGGRAVSRIFRLRCPSQQGGRHLTKHKQQQVPPPASAENPSAGMSVAAESLRVLPPFPFVSCKCPSKRLRRGGAVPMSPAGRSGAPGITGAHRVPRPQPWVGDTAAGEPSPGQSQALDADSSR